MISTSVEFSYDLVCSKCQNDVYGSKDGSNIEIEPCESCLEEAREEGEKYGK